MAEQNTDIIVDEIVIGGGSGPGGQLIVGDTIEISGTWDATDADPVPGDSFTIGIPPELQIPTDIPFDLTGPNGDGEIVPFANCVATAATNEVVCTLTDEVAANPELVHGDFALQLDVVAATDEEEVVFDLNGEDTGVDLPGEGGIGDGVEVPDEWSKTGELNANKWSMTWTIELPGEKLAGHSPVHVSDTLGAGHKLCDPSLLKVEAVRGGTVVDVTDIATIQEPGTGGADFDIVLTEPTDGWDEDFTYRITYDTCTPDGEIDPQGTVYENSAYVDVWDEGIEGVGVEQDWDFNADIKKSGTVLGGADRNGIVEWEVQLSGSYLFGKDGFEFRDTMTGPHQLCAATIESARVYQQLGPSTEQRIDVTSEFEVTGGSVSDDLKELDIEVSIREGSDFEFEEDPYVYGIVYDSCVTTEGLPEGGEEFGNEVNVDGAVVGTETETPGRTDRKSGSINSSAVTIDGVEHLPQTTLSWTITVPGEKLADISGPVTVTDVLGDGMVVCEDGDTGDPAERLALRAEARDQISNGGLTTVDLRDEGLVDTSIDGQNLTFVLDEPTLTQPDGTTATGWSREYQYVITYTTCTASGGMDAPGTVYSNDATVAGSQYTSSTTQNNSGSGSGQGVQRGSVSIDKALADTPGAEFVPDDATFTVHVKEFAPGATEPTIEYDLQVPLNGDPVSGPNSRGNGWTIELSEPTVPSIPGVTFGDPVFEPGPGVTVSDDGTTATAELVPNTNIDVTLTNDTQLGAISIVKELEGGASELVPADQAFEVTAAIDTSELGDDFPAQEDRVFDLTAGEPYVIDDLPIGAVVTFTETQPGDDDRFTWGTPVFDPSSVTVEAGTATTPATVTLTNSVERTVGTFSLEKTVTGEQADNPAVPDSVTVTVTWTEEGSTEQSKELSIPTDGTPVPLGENLLIGTEVTLTETPLDDGSSIAWGAPVWSGTGVTIDGESAVVTIGRDAQAAVSLENHAATSTAGISLLKSIAGEAAGEVDPSTEFPVTATWTDADGVEQSKDLTINAVGPTPLGEDLPAGTVVTITEGEAPGFDTVVWGSVTISGDAVTDNGDGSSTVVVSEHQGDVTLISVTNEATWAPGTFSLSKQVDGVLLDDPDVPEAVTVTASWIEDGEPVTTTIAVPTDGTVVPFGEALPHGTEVTLSEEPLEGAPAFTWDDPTWEAEGIVVNDDGTATITIGAAEDIAVTLTNSAVESLGSLELLKVLSGDGASDVPAGMIFPVTATWTDIAGVERRAELQLTAGEPEVLDGLPLGTEVTLTEGEASTPSDVTWLGAEWSSDDENVALSGSGTEAVVTVTGEPGTVASVTLDNEYEEASGLAVTGGEAIGTSLVALALALIGGGAVVVTKRRRAV